MKFTTTAGKQFFFCTTAPFVGWTVVEFYDQTYMTETSFQPHGQMMASYYLSTFLEIEEGSGLNLHGGVPGWELSPEDVAFVKENLL